jgi:hypothetical protein
MPEDAEQPKVLSEREKAIKAYHDATTKEAKAAVVKDYPLLKHLYTDVNHCVIAFLIFLFAAVSARAGSTTLIGSLVTVNGTSNSVSVAAGSFALPSGYFFIQNGGLASTQALTVNIQASMDNTNFVTVAVYTPSATNATTDRFTPSYAVQTIYFRAQAVTTNAVGLGGTFVQ